MKLLAFIILLAAGIAGCVRREVIALNDYASIVRGAGDPEVAVALRVEDARPLRPGGEPVDIGVIDESLGNTTVLELSDPAAIRHLVRAATLDALRLARIGVSPQAPRTLVATIRKFWVAVPSREEHLVIDLLLQDPQGAVLWRASAIGGAGGWIWTQSTLLGIYQRTLADYAEAANKRFTSREFQRQLY